MTLKQIKQALCGLGAGLVLLFVFNTVTGLHEAHNQVREIPALVARMEKLESDVIDLRVAQAQNRKDTLETVEELKITTDYLTRIMKRATGVKLNGD